MGLHGDPLSPEDQEFANHIAESVLAVLTRRSFFEQLETRVYPAGDNGSGICDHSYRQTEAVVSGLDLSEDDLADIILVFRSRGGFCDCEVLLNVDEREDSPRARYWRARSLEAAQ